MSHKVNLVRVLTTATGNSTPITLGAAYSQLFMLPSEAGAMDGRVYTYLIVDGNNWELGKGVYTASGTSLARTTIIASRISGTLGTSRITLSGTAQVRFIESSEDMDGVRGTRAVTGTSDTLNNSDLGYVVTYSNAAAVAVSLAQASVSNLFLDGWAVFVKNKGAGAVTITPATSTIDGAATLVLKQNQGALIWSDGTNYQSFRFRDDINQSVAIGAVDLNTIIAPGTYYCTSGSATNGPVAGGQWYLEVLIYGSVGAGFLMQRATNLLNAADTYTRTNFNGTWGAWHKLVDVTAAASFMRSYLAGLTLSTAGSSSTFGVAAGTATDSTNVDVIVLASAYTKTMSTWAVGSGNGGLDTGGVTSTWYHVYLIKRPDTGVVDVLFSLSASTPTLPTNYTIFRRIGAMFITPSGFWASFSQNGDEYLWATPVNDVSTSALGTTATLYPLSVPTGVKVNALFRGYATGSSTVTTLINSPDETSTSPNAVNGNDTSQNTTSGTTSGAIFTLNVRTNTSGQIRAVSTTAGTTLTIATHGWIDRRGRDA